MLDLAPAVAADLALEYLDDGLWDELTPLLYANWDEASGGDENAPELDPDRSSYDRLAAVGALRVFTARLATPSPQRGRLIGYAAYVVTPSMHHRSVILARHDAFFLLPEHRRGLAAQRLLGFADEQLRNEGVQVIQQSARPASSFASLLTRLGYTVAEYTYRKVIT